MAFLVPESGIWIDLDPMRCSICEGIRNSGSCFRYCVFGRWRPMPTTAWWRESCRNAAAPTCPRRRSIPVSNAYESSKKPSRPLSCKHSRRRWSSASPSARLPRERPPRRALSRLHRKLFRPLPTTPIGSSRLSNRHHPTAHRRVPVRRLKTNHLLPTAPTLLPVPTIRAIRHDRDVVQTAEVGGTGRTNRAGRTVLHCADRRERNNTRAERGICVTALWSTTAFSLAQKPLRAANVVEFGTRGRALTRPPVRASDARGGRKWRNQ